MWAAGACLFATGAASLVYEITWVRQASLLFGSGTFAVGTVLGVFFLGLALGSEISGRMARRLVRPLVTFAGIEAILALWALTSPGAFVAAEAWLVALHEWLRPHTGLLLAGRVSLVAAIVLPPTVLMGASLPLVCRQFVRDDREIGRSVARLYALNTLGAAAGCLATGYWLLPELGVTGSVRLAAALNGGAALGALLLARSAAPFRDATSSEMTLPVNRPGPVPWSLASLVFLFGFVALGHEVLWSRVLTLVLRNTVQTWSLTLGMMLLGIVIGSLLVAPRIDRSPYRAWWLGLAQMTASLVVLATLLMPPTIWRGLGQGAVALLLVPAALWGASFPLVVRLAVATADRASSAVGRLTAVNGVGGIAGSLAVSFVGVPWLGVAACAHILTALGILAGAIAWLALGVPERRPANAAAVVVATMAWAALPLVLDTRLPDDYLAAPGEALVAVTEGRTGNLAVLRRGQATSLEIDRWWQGGDWQNHQSVAAYVPLLLHPAPRRVLVVGAGTGQTPRSALTRDVEQIDVVDIEPAVFDVIRSHFDARWLDDPRVTQVADDGRHHVLLGGARYDLVSLELGQLFVPAVAASYTVEFYERVRACLRPGGVVSQFVPTAFLTPELFRRMIASFRAAFPQSLLWYNTSELMLLGTTADRWRLAPERLASLTEDPELHAALA